MTTAAAAGQAVTITSFGYLHGEPPRADLPVDLRVSYRDPHVDPALRELTAADPRVQAAVLATPGVLALVSALTAAVRDLLRGGPVTVAVGCAGGRHRSSVVADQVAARLRVEGIAVTVVHRDIGEPVVARADGGRPS